MMYYFNNSVKDSPTIILDSKSRSGLIKGRATCNDQMVYLTVQNEIINYFKEYDIQNFSIKLESFNVKMAKSLIEILKVLHHGLHVPKIHWVYSKEDLEMKQMGKYYCKLLNIDFDFVEN